MHRVGRLFLLVSLAACGGGGDSAPAPPTAPAPSPAPAAPAGQATCGLEAFQADALRLINDHRAAGASCGARGSFAPAPAVRWDERLAAAAAGHARDMAEHDYFQHEGREGGTPAQRVSAEGYDWRTVGENIAAGQRSVAEAVNGWMASDGHCANLMTAQFRDIGMACASNDGSTYRRYWVLDMAARR
jgi:uncharacterized protein YkwD